MSSKFKNQQGRQRLAEQMPQTNKSQTNKSSRKCDQKMT